MLTELQRIATSGARAVETFVRDGERYLVVAQLAEDVPGQAAAMTAGDSDVETLVLRLDGDAFVPHQTLDVPGGEDAEAFTIEGRQFLATASLRAGRGPYAMDVESTLFEWRDGRFAPRQKFRTHAAKQWTHVEVDGRHFLALAQGVGRAGEAQPAHARSCLLEWDGERFVHFQDVPSAWGYNFLPFVARGAHWLAYADHAEPSILMRWTGRRFEPAQRLEGESGRAFAHLRVGGDDRLAFACLLGETWTHRFADDGTLVREQRLSGPGGREFAWLPSADGGGRLLQVNFILGSREAPRPVVPSIVHAWTGERFEPVDTLATTGGTDAVAFDVGGRTRLAVSNSLSAELRFAADTVVYGVAP